MKTYKTLIPEIELKFKRSEISKVKIKSSEDANEVGHQLFNPDTMDLYENVAVLYLNRANNSTGFIQVSTGGMVGAIVDIRLILATALKCGATSMILYHNHPSGNRYPSEADKKLTNKLKEAGDIMDIKLLDHLILTSDNGYYSFADENGL